MLCFVPTKDGRERWKPRLLADADHGEAAFQVPQMGRDGRSGPAGLANG